MEHVTIGTRVNSLGINRTNCAEGGRCRAVLIDPNPCVKFIAYDEKRKRKVEVDQELVIKYGLRPITNFFYLIAKCNTDMKGNIVDNDFVIEYLQLSESRNNEFADSVAETPDFTSISYTKVKQTGPDGKDFSYLKVIPSNYKVPDAILEKIKTFQDNPDNIRAMWALVDRTTSITGKEYEELLAQENGESAPQVAAPQPAKQVSAPKQPKVAAPQPPAVDDFGVDFNDGADFEGM